MNQNQYNDNIEENFKSSNCPSTLVKFSGLNENIEREVEALLAIGNGFIGARNSLEESNHDFSDSATFVAGLYRFNEIEEIPELIKIPDWTRFNIFIENEQVDLLNVKTLELDRYLDFKRGVVSRVWKFRDYNGRITKVQILKFISFADKNLCLKSIYIQPINYCGKMKLQSLIDYKNIDLNSAQVLPSFDNNYLKLAIKEGSIEFILAQKSSFYSHSKFNGQRVLPISDRFISNNSIVEEWEWFGCFDNKYNITSFVSIHSNIDSEDYVQENNNHIKRIDDSCIDAHITEWKRLWDQSYIEICGNKDAQRWVNFTIYHLLIAGRYSGEKYSISARSFTGTSYKGHIFWDTEIYLLPFYLYTNPSIAKNLLMYRYNTLDGARKNAKMEGREGACYAWESTDDGIEATPLNVLTPSGEVITIYSGLYENHISSDIAYAVWNYYCATDDLDFLLRYGAEIIFETAKFCVSLCEKKEDGLYHIDRVEGPDEYHELVDDNTFTNVMTRHNFRIAIKAKDILAEYYPHELDLLLDKIDLNREVFPDWDEISTNIYISQDSLTQVFEQFNGYFKLENIDLEQFEPRTVAMDILLGREKTTNSQVIKQPDVLMFLFLLKTQFTKEELLANYEYYEPKTGHGSSLSPSIHSILASWLGKKDEAYSYFQKNAGIDLGPELGTAASGIHIAAHGGVWMSVVFGFAGVWFSDDILNISPSLPKEIGSLNFSLTWKRQVINFNLNHSMVRIENTGDKPVKASFYDAEEFLLQPKTSKDWRVQ